MLPGPAGVGSWSTDRDARVQIAMVTYPNMTALDLMGPYEVLGQWPDPAVEVHTVATTPGPIRCDNGATLVADMATAELPRPDVIVVPGAGDPRGGTDDEALIDWLREAGVHAQHVMSVCTGAALLARAGLLEGKRATTHWGWRDRLRQEGVEVSDERVVRDGKVLTTAGVSAGIDGALMLAAELWGETAAQTLQLAIEYDPQPPFDAGSVDKAPPEVVALLRAVFERTLGKT